MTVADWAQALVSFLVGAIAGGLTVRIRMNRKTVSQRVSGSGVAIARDNRAPINQAERHD